MIRDKLESTSVIEKWNFAQPYAVLTQTAHRQTINDRSWTRPGRHHYAYTDCSRALLGGDAVSNSFRPHSERRAVVGLTNHGPPRGFQPSKQVRSLHPDARAVRSGVAEWRCSAFPLPDGTRGAGRTGCGTGRNCGYRTAIYLQGPKNLLSAPGCRISQATRSPSAAPRAFRPPEDIEQANQYHHDLVATLEALARGAKTGRVCPVREGYLQYAVGCTLCFGARLKRR